MELEISKKPVWGRRSGWTELFSTSVLLIWVAGYTNLHEILTDIAAKRKPRGGNFANGVLNSYFLKENNKESEKMGTYMICGILIIVIVAALLGSRKHFKGEGGCCGGGGDVKIKPKHLDTIVATKKLQIEGMSCINCQNRIENALNGMAQVNAKASFKKGEAIVKLGVDIPEEELREAVEKLGYKVTSIELM